MHVHVKGNTVIIKPSSDDLSVFAEKILASSEFEDKNVILDLHASGTLKPEQFEIFVALKKLQKKNKRSLLIVADTDYHKTTKMNVVPTLQEAHDMIEMDEIERDLGF